MNINCIEKIRENINYINNDRIEKVNGILVTTLSNIRYILGINIEGYVYIDNSNVYVLTDGRYIENTKKCIQDIDNVFCIDLIHRENIVNILKNKTVLIEGKDITIYKSKRIKEIYQIKDLVETEDLIENIRTIKNDYEIENIKKACQITDIAFSYILTYIKPGMTEKQIKDELEYYMKKIGAENISFDAIVASGPNSSKPHAISGDRKIEEQDIILMDFGCKYNGYCSDMTRTIFVGDANEKQRQVYEIVKNAQQKVLDNTRENVNVKDIDNMVHDEFRKYNFEENYLHSTGHGVGLDIHESPSVSRNIEYILKENMVITDEPGIYFENEFGIRIEDTILVTKDGVYNFFSSSKDIIII